MTKIGYNDNLVAEGEHKMAMVEATLIGTVQATVNLDALWPQSLTRKKQLLQEQLTELDNQFKAQFPDASGPQASLSLAMLKAFTDVDHEGVLSTRYGERLPIQFQEVLARKILLQSRMNAVELLINELEN